MVSTVDGAIGIMLLIYYAIARRKVKMGPGILYFGIFTLMMGMWSMNEAELVAYMVKSRTAASYTGYMMIMLMIAPFAAFLQEFSEVEEKYISNIICICSFANAIAVSYTHRRAAVDRQSAMKMHSPAILSAIRDMWQSILEEDGLSMRPTREPV